MIFIKRNLFLCRSVRLHPPDLHGSRRIRVVVDVLSVGRIFRPVDMTGAVERKLYFLSAADGLFIQVVNFAAALCDVGDLAVTGIPAMTLRRGLLGEQFCFHARH